MISNAIFDIFSFGGSPEARYLYIVLISVLSAVIFLILFKKTSHQEKISYHKKQIWGNILQIRLYQDRFFLLVLSVFNILKHNLLYLQQMLIPLLIIMFPLVIFTIQINNRCGYEPLQVNQRFLIRVHLDSRSAADFDLFENIYCETTSNIELETPPLRMEKEGKVFWRARIVSLPTSESASYIRVGIQGNDSVIEKSVMTNYRKKRFAPEKKKWSLWNELFHNAERFLSKEAVFDTVSITYHRATYGFLFWNVDAIVLYFLLTLVFAFALKGFMKVKI